MAQGRPKLKLKHFSIEAKLLVAVAIVSALMLYPAGMVNEALFWDDKAYINNALIASGRISPDQAWGPHAEERPPLFWWLITGLFLLGSPTWIVRLVSPTFGVLAAIGIFTFSSRVFRDVWAGFSSALLLSLSWFYVSTTSDILSDTMGAALSIFCVLCMCLGLRHTMMVWLSGPLLALSIMARDQNLILIPASIVFLICVLDIHVRTKMILFISLLVLFGVPLIFLPLEEVLQQVSNWITPLVVRPLFVFMVLVLTGLNAILVTHPSHRLKTRNVRQVEPHDILLDAGFAFFLGVILLFPYLIDNYRLSEEFQIAGKGVLSRPISHVIMSYIGIGAELPAPTRWAWWMQHTLQFVTVPTLVLAVAGAVLLLRSKQQTGKILTTWAVLSLLYVIFFTHLEERFLVQSLPPLFILAGYTVSEVGRRWRPAAFVAAITATVFLIFPSMPTMPLPHIDQTPPTISALLSLTGLKHLDQVWLTPYLAYSQIAHGLPRIQVIYPALGILSLILPLIAIYVSWKTPKNSNS